MNISDLRPLPTSYALYAKAGTDIVETLAKVNQQPISEYLSRTRQEWIMWPRSVAKFLLRRVFGAPYQAIGLIFKCDHTSVIYAERMIAERCGYDPDFKQIVEDYLKYFHEKYPEAKGKILHVRIERSKAT